mmetsp:Transcript_111354/g.197292  ORF Transcript_111354/g.197292 Transcript_111354/m.197292 type:complete len:209 (+) Transcript_111354:409-1035(+)
MPASPCLCLGTLARTFLAASASIFAITLGLATPGIGATLSTPRVTALAAPSVSTFPSPLSTFAIGAIPATAFAPHVRTVPATFTIPASLAPHRWRATPAAAPSIPRTPTFASVRTAIAPAFARWGAPARRSPRIIAFAFAHHGRRHTHAHATIVILPALCSWLDGHLAIVDDGGSSRHCSIKGFLRSKSDKAKVLPITRLGVLWRMHV